MGNCTYGVLGFSIVSAHGSNWSWYEVEVLRSTSTKYFEVHPHGSFAFHGHFFRMTVDACHLSISPAACWLAKEGEYSSNTKSLRLVNFSRNKLDLSISSFFKRSNFELWNGERALAILPFGVRYHTTNNSHFLPTKVREVEVASGTSKRNDKGSCGSSD